MKSKIIMDSGKEYIVNDDVEALNEHYFTHKDGRLINGMVYMSGFAINPSHISSVEYLD